MNTIQKIFDLMNKNGLTKNSAHIAIGVPSGLFSDWESGKKKPGVRSLKKISEYFKVPMSYFLDDNDEQKKSPVISTGDIDLDNLIAIFKNINEDGRKYIMQSAQNASCNPLYQKSEDDAETYGAATVAGTQKLA